MPHLIIGTAGHVDHGKTRLIQTLTGVDCDTHPEEKQRGITIHLGFTHLTFPDGIDAGIVDVPGHGDFVGTMAAGAAGIDIALLVIAADEGVMPQTREHLRILEVLGVRRGLIALTRCDLADQLLIETASAEAREAVQGTFLEDAPVVPVSSVTGSGIPLLRDQLHNIVRETPQRDHDGAFRMWIDRVFSVKGFGQVVTGTVADGTLALEDTVYLLPGGERFRVRQLERHGQKVSHVTAGDRAAINLTGGSQNPQRGMLLGLAPVSSSRLLDCTLRLFTDSGGLKLWSQGVVHCGTWRSQARIHLLDRDGLKAGREALVQFHLEQPVCLQNEERFILRDTSGGHTLGGGMVLDAHPLHHKRRPKLLIERLRRLRDLGIRERLRWEILKHPRPVRDNELASILNRPVGVVTELLQEITSAEYPEEKEDITVYQHDGHIFAIPGYMLAGIRKNLLRGIRLHHKRNPLENRGYSLSGLHDLILGSFTDRNTGLLDLILHKLETEGLVKQVDDTWALMSHQAEQDSDTREHIRLVERMFRDFELHVPLMSRIIPESAEKGIDRQKLQTIITYLTGRGRLIHIDAAVLHHGIVDASRLALLQALSQAPEKGMSVAGFRDLLHANRKICLALFAQFDKEGIVIRRGDERFITRKGKQVFEDIR